MSAPAGAPGALAAGAGPSAAPASSRAAGSGAPRGASGTPSPLPLPLATSAFGASFFGLTPAAQPDAAAGSAASPSSPPRVPPAAETAEAPAGAAVATAVDTSAPAPDAEELQRCRVCFGGAEDGALIRLSCACRGELALCHEACAAKWFRRRRSGVCELCNQQAFALPADAVTVPVRLDPYDAILRHRAAGGTAPRARYITLLSSLALTLGLIVAGALSWMVPSLHCRSASLPAGILPVCFLVLVMQRRIHMALPRSITSSWHATFLLLALFGLVDISILMTGGGSGSWC